MVAGIKVVKVFNHEKEAIADFKQRNQAYRRAATSANFLLFFSHSTPLIA